MSSPRQASFLVPIRSKSKLLATVILEYLTLLPQEVSNADLTGTRRVQILQECKDAIPLVLSTLATLLHQSQSTEIALKCFASWIQYGIDIEQAYPLLEQTMKLLVSNDDVLEVAAEALIEGMQQSTWSNYQNFRNGLLVSFTSDAIMLKCKTSLEEEDEILGRALAKLLTTFAETYVDDIAGQLALPEIRNLMTMILQLTGFPGFYPVDQAVSEIPLNFWFMLQETLFDQGLIPVRHAAAIPDGDDDISLTQPTDNEQLAWNRQCGETALALYRDLLGIIEQKSVFPGSSVWQSWTKAVVVTWTNHIFAYMQQGATLPLEASLFCLRMVSEEIPASENDHISKLFASTFLSQLASDPNIRLRNTCLGLLGSLADWLNEHPQYLVSAMNFIVPCMGEPRLSMQAANSFANICNTCRASLIDNLDSLMAVYGSTSASTMEPLAMHKVVESVAAVIQVLPIERSLRPLMTLTASIFQAIEYGFQQDQEMARTTMLSQLKNLTACCKGIQSPDDDYASLSERNRQFDAFASGQLSAMCTQVEGFQETTASLQHVIQQCMLHWSKDEDIARILTQFLEAGIRSMSPLLTLTFSDLTHLIDSGYKAGRFAYWLETTSLVITVYGGHPPHLPVLCSLFDSLTTCTFQGITSTAGKNKSME
ncbi:hypothetical protein DM01DRAFT_1363853 [Hesseltinella vesiculosa]|uniref:Exportin-1/Importin-beta-like domain-containing protein n=1 Tax=Hesseltinella vesiculosa TaxID=101127 RepID=A0A1X2GBW7_9FUNG|nr:hypothetical protein DM01DRAFT_1363853 [Hesseltinella vesiculosa]